MHAEYMLVPLKERNRKKENLILIDSDLKNDLFVPEHILGKYSKRRKSNVAVIHVRIVSISSFFFYCHLLNHSFPTNPNRITNCFSTYSSLYITTLQTTFAQCVRLF